MTAIVPTAVPHADVLAGSRARDAVGGRAPAPSKRAPRDPFVDTARALGTLLVVALHWLMVEATWDGASLAVGNALSHGVGWVLTWLQPLPLLFFAAGAAAVYDRGRHQQAGGWAYARARLRRVVPPVAVLGAVWAAAAVALPALGVPATAVARTVRIVPQPLWFLGVWAVLLAATPLLHRSYRRHGSVVLVLAVGAPLLVDVARFVAGAGVVAWANVVLVWAIPYVLGIAYAESRHAADPTATGAFARPAGLWTMLVGGTAAAVALIAWGPYPRSMIGLPGDAISNLAPPTAPVVAFALAQVAAALLVRERLGAWGRRSPVLAWVGARSMPVYVWHLTAMFVVVGVVLFGFHRSLPTPWGWEWWTSRPAYLGAAALVLVVLTRLAHPRR